MDKVYESGLEAWRALQQIGGLEIDGRDADLLDKLRELLCPSAFTLEEALARRSIEQFLRALFQIIEPFAAMFSDILEFFEQAGARRGRTQWRLRIDESLVEFQHFEEFLLHWREIEAEIDIPALDLGNAWMLNDLRLELEDPDTLSQGLYGDGPPVTGIADVDSWLTAYESGEYSTFPASLYPDQFQGGLADVAGILLAAVSILRDQGETRARLLEAHYARGYRVVAGDALHPWSIAQSETDYWLRSHVFYLANTLRLPADQQDALAASLKEKLERFPRRRIVGKLAIEDLERILSLPVWKQRYETYGVWIATRIAAAADGHDIEYNAPDAGLRFAFSETLIADIETASPRLSLYSEKRVPLADPVGEGRKCAVQPDYSLWKQGADPAACPLVVEVKHYKKRSARNFRDALEDYARAHPAAEVVLVNYGPVGAEFTDLDTSVSNRCRMIGNLTPLNRNALNEFRDIVRELVGEPVRGAAIGCDDEVLAIDVSASMSDILESEQFKSWLSQFEGRSVDLVLVDGAVRTTISVGEFGSWRAANQLGSSTSLKTPLQELLEKYGRISLFTDSDGVDGLEELRVSGIDITKFEIGAARLVTITR
ncbi:hypothetical protein [Qipengyuania sphaerica]|uniref:hypothetical protein n=1 Tax=Qipengyuania sphaerica TaxID=2867243 RepID=UPI001C884E7C|nr:hypothetical protein [Qipengyuania sphaerica]MBX7540325.1 hypothetical protein [Qipengyuania sphaerica]